MQFFYTPDISGDCYTFTKEESRHCIKVLRKKLGDTIYLVDGRGKRYTTCLTDDNPKACQVEVQETEDVTKGRDYHIHLAVAPTKNMDRFEWFLEKATEIGVDEITPIICDHSERKVIKAERLQKIVIAAMKQSLKADLPILNEATSLSHFLKENHQGQCFIAHCEEREKHSLKDSLQLKEDVLLLIGPEGDFSSTEIEIASSKGFQAVSLGNSRLRTETAAVVACHSINLLNE